MFNEQIEKCIYSPVFHRQAGGLRQAAAQGRANKHSFRINSSVAYIEIVYMNAYFCEQCILLTIFVFVISCLISRLAALLFKT